jgi:CO dehydrogenase maturation factor
VVDGRGLRIAFVGKGGAGKSLIAGTLCRQLARSGQCVLAMDVDTMVGLSLSVGLGRKVVAGLPSGLAERVEGKGWQIKLGLQPARLVDRFAIRGPDGVRYLELGKLPSNVEPSVTVAFRHVLEHFRRRHWSVVADLAAGTRQPMFGWARFARTVIVVADPSAKSLLAARRLARAGIGSHVVANRVQGDRDLADIQQAIPLPLLGWVPYDASVADAERNGAAPIDIVPNAPAVKAIAHLAARLIGKLQ